MESGGGHGTLWLVGMMGAGKSTVGPLLAARLGRAFLDTDAEIESDAGTTIPELFERHGEPGFRRAESAAIDRVAPSGAVVSVGGGALTVAENEARMVGSGRVVYLKARAATLAARIGDGDDRPLLAGLDEPGRAARLEGLLAERREAYERASVIVEVDEREPAEVVSAIVQALEGALESPA